MEIGVIITTLSILIGIAAGIVQVVQYFQDRKKKKQEIPPREDILPSIAINSDYIKHNLPHPDYKEFVGRDKEIEEIISILNDRTQSQADIIFIYGIGGIGKSALAIEIAYRLFWSSNNSNSKGGFEAIIWTSARTNVYTSEKIVSYTSSDNILNLIYITITTTLNRQELTTLKSPEQHEAIRHLLTQQKTLLIIDNIDTFDDELLVFLRNLPEPTKVLITTRQQINIGQSIQLRSLSSKDAKNLIRSEIRNERYRRGINLSRKDIQDLHKKTWGVPLAIVLVMAQIGEGIGIQSILSQLGKKTDDIARYCFENALEHIRGTHAWKILIALSMFPAGTKRDVLSAITELSEEDMDLGLRKLSQLSLINQTTTQKLWMLPLIIEYARDEFVASPREFIEKTKHNFAKTYLNIKIESALAAKAFIHAVHLAIDLSDLYAWDSQIANYLEANQIAVQHGVKIIRIFVLDKYLTYLDDQYTKLHPEIVRILDEQIKIKIDVKILWRDVIKNNKLAEPPDMIIFDGKEIHLHIGHGGWYHDVIISNDIEEIENWEKEYQKWLDHSLNWLDIRKII